MNSETQNILRILNVIVLDLIYYGSMDDCDMSREVLGKIDMTELKKING